MSTPLVEQKPFNGHTPGEVFVSDDAIVAREAPDDGGDIIASAPAGYEDSMRRWQDNAAFLAHCWNTYYQREAELQSMRERLSRMESRDFELIGHLRTMKADADNKRLKCLTSGHKRDAESLAALSEMFTKLIEWLKPLQQVAQ